MPGGGLPDGAGNGHDLWSGVAIALSKEPFASFLRTKPFASFGARSLRTPFVAHTYVYYGIRYVTPPGMLLPSGIHAPCIDVQQVFIFLMIGGAKRPRFGGEAAA